jgi:hypothetical protein
MHAMYLAHVTLLDLLMHQNSSFYKTFRRLQGITDSFWAGYAGLHLDVCMSLIV